MKCFAAIGGAVVSVLITYLIMRKKRGAPAPAMAAVPTGEVPALPESSTPPEAAATDTPTPEETLPPEG